ncbi:mechanosensitive ion channel [bacterium]|nr:mechanosensitive ion channel [bacterium]
MDFSEFLNFELIKLAQRSVTVGGVLTAIALFAVALAVSRLFRSGLDRLRGRVAPEGGSALYVAGQFGRYIIVLVGLIAAGSALGIDLSSLTLFAGALGVGVGLGLQDIVKDFFSGIVLLLEDSLEVGDFIELDASTNGEILAIRARATTIKTNDNVHIVVPNSMLLTGRMINWTRSRATRRVHVPFPVALGSDKEKVRQAALEAAQAVPSTLPDNANRRTQVWLVSYGESAMNFELVVWPTLEAVKRPGAMMAAYMWAIDDALRRYGIETPYPQRDIRLRAVFGREGDDGASSLSLAPPTAAPRPAERSPDPEDNDAAAEIRQVGGKKEEVET